jgi:type IV pilus assembly protein PilX
MKSTWVKQRGATLLTVLLLLLIMTLIALATMRGTLMQEKMSGNLYDRSLSFQATEVALRNAEREMEDIANRADILGLNDDALTSGDFSCDPATGYCPSPDDNQPERWLVEANWVNGPLVNGVQTQFMIEYMGDWPSWRDCDKVLPQDAACMTPRYRISARSDNDNRSQTVLQSNYSAPAL